MLKVILLVTSVILGVLVYKVYNDNQYPKYMKTVQRKQNIGTTEKSILVKDRERIAQKRDKQTKKKEAMEIGKDLQVRKYEEIENDTSLTLSDEEKVSQHLEDIVNEEMNIHDQSKPLSEEEIKAMMAEEIRQMKNLEYK
jgi:hypothetical protein